MTTHGRLTLTIDPAVSAEQSVALRYAPTLLCDELTRDALTASSIREGIRLLDLGDYRGVRLFLVDESTQMASGTYKSLDGCVSTAVCRHAGTKRIVFSSGSNVGIAMMMYGERLDLETYFFCPTSTLYKIDGALFDRPTAHLIAVEGTDRQVKEAAQRFGKQTNSPTMPTEKWRLRAAACRGLFLAEQFRASPRRFNWLTQSICAGYGPLGIYRALEDLIATGTIERAMAPKFLGIQQSELSPIADAWNSGLTELPPASAKKNSEPLIEPSLYNVHPSNTYPELRGVLQQFGGTVATVSAADFARLEPEFTRLLRNVGVNPTPIEANGKPQYVERAGIMAGVGTLLAIENGTLKPGESALCHFTGGAGPAPKKSAKPDCVIGAQESIEAQLGRYLEQAASRPRAS